MRPVLPSSSPREPFDPFLPDIPRPAPAQLPNSPSPILPTAGPVSQTLVESHANGRRLSFAVAAPAHRGPIAGSLLLPLAIPPLYGERDGQMRQKNRTERLGALARVA